MQTNFFGQEISRPMMAIKLKQPYAALMLHGKIETRTWDTSIRGKVMLCSSLVPYNIKEMLDYCDEAMLELITNLVSRDKNAKILGCAYAVGELVHTRKMVKSDEARCFVSFNPRLYCHIYENVRPIQPFLYVPAGLQKWKKVTDQETLGKIIYL